MNRLPHKTEYRLLRDLVDGKITPDQLPADEGQSVREFVTTPHQEFDPQAQSYGQFIEDHFNTLMGLVTRISLDALHHKNLSLLIFPQGTRSIRLLPGLTGIAQIALKARATVVPVGVNGSEKCYPSSMPFSSGGKVLYRIGQPIDLADDPIEDFEPFTRSAEEKFGSRFRKLTDLITDRINDLLDPPYQLAPNDQLPTETGVKRFI
jgi:1-acyl-sn-glycerol-3-phosphate acyltransferase